MASTRDSDHIYKFRYTDEQGVEHEFEQDLSQIAPQIVDLSSDSAVHYVTTNGTGPGWSSIGSNYYIQSDTDVATSGTYQPYSRWMYENTAKVSWNPFDTYNKLQDMYCECCGVHTQVLPEDYRLNYVCDDCKDSVPLLMLMKKFFREIESK